MGKPAKKAKEDFARKVIAVVNRRSETKSWSYVQAFTGLSSWQTYNLTAGITQGANTAQRIGDRIFIKTLRIRHYFQNTDSVGSTTNPHTGQFRIVVFRGKYDNFALNYSVNEVFEGNAGDTNYQTITAKIDTNQVTPLKDKQVSARIPSAFMDTRVTPNFINSNVLQTYVEYTIKINRNFVFKDDDAYGKTSNLYLGIVYQNGGGTANYCHSFQSDLTFTDAV